MNYPLTICGDRKRLIQVASAIHLCWIIIKKSSVNYWLVWFFFQKIVFFCYSLYNLISIFRLLLICNVKRWVTNRSDKESRQWIKYNFQKTVPSPSLTILYQTVPLEITNHNMKMEKNYAERYTISTKTVVTVFYVNNDLPQRLLNPL